MTPLRIGHRGCKAIEPENTLKAFRKAVEYGLDYIEFDVRLSEDDEIVVIHDREVDRTTDGTGLVRALSAAALQTFDAGEGERIPLLRDVFSELKGKVNFMIEVKASHLVKPLVDLIHEFKLTHEVIIISFIHRWLKEIKDIDARIKTGVIWSGCPIHPSQIAKDAKADMVIPNFWYLEKDTIEECHAAGIKVIPWGMDSKEDIRQMISWGADGVSADDPELFS